MHVALICRSFPHHRAGGMEWHAQDIADGLMAGGHTVTVCTTPLPDEAALADLKVNGEVLIFGKRSASYDAAFALDIRRRLAKEVHRLGCEVVHAQGFAGVFALPALRGSVPLVTTIHGTLWSETPLRSELRGITTRGQYLRLNWRFKHRILFSPLWKRFIQSAPGLVVDSKYTAYELRKEVGRFKPRPTLVPLGFDTGRFPMGDRAAARQRWNAEDDEVLLVSLGRIEEVKGQGVLLDAFLSIAGEHPKAKLVIAGEGPLRDSLINQAQQTEFAHQIQFPGRVSSEETPGLLQAADFFLNPDQGAPAFGLANAEALVMGTPVLATNVGAHPEIIDAKLWGRLVRPIGKNAWQRYLREALNNPGEFEPQRAERAAQARERFSRDLMVGRLLEVYRKAMNNYLTPLPISTAAT